MDIDNVFLIGCQNAYLSKQFTATGGVPPYTWEATNPPLPADLVISSSGLLYGNITVPAGSYTFDITVTDADLTEVTETFTLYVKDTPTLVEETLPVAESGYLYSHTITATDQSASAAFELASGTLPPGLVLNATTGEISGTPTNPGNYTLTIKITN